MHWIFAYGSNMHLEDLQRWMSTRNLPPARILQAEAAVLLGHRLVWNYYSPARGGGAANIEPSDTDLPGVVLQVDEDTFGAIDRKEGYPGRYGRQRSRALLMSGRMVTPWVYSVRDEYRSPEQVCPTRAYRALLIEGALEFGLPRIHIDALELLETCD